MLPELLISKLRILYLHSRRRYLINSIPLLSIVTLLVGVGINCVNANYTYAADQTIGDSTASMTLDTSDVVVNVVPGETGYASKSITVSTNNTESYALIITAPAVLKNESSNSTNPWSYAYGQSGELSTMSYTNFDGNTKELESGIESSGSTKTLAFSSTFAEGLASGHYKAEVTLGLVSTPKTVLGVWTLADGNTQASGITTMQEMTPSICKQVNTPVAVATPGGTNAPTMKLKDTRDDNIYSIAKYPDGRCWMTENLKLMGSRTLTSTDSDVSSNYSIPSSSTSGFSDNTAQNVYVTNNTGYYTWCAATAGTCSSTTSNGKNAPSSICPKGWKLPTGQVVSGENLNSTNDVYNLFNNLGLKYQGSGLASGGTSWGAGDLNIVQGSPYNFAHTGYMVNSTTSNLGNSVGYWWSRTAYDGPIAYFLGIDDNSVTPGTSGNPHRFGYAVRCVAEKPEPKTFTLNYVCNIPGAEQGYKCTQEVPADTCTTTADSCSLTLHNSDINNNSCSVGTWMTLGGWNTKSDKSGTQYSLGQEITLTGNMTLYGTWDVQGFC